MFAAPPSIRTQARTSWSASSSTTPLFRRVGKLHLRRCGSMVCGSGPCGLQGRGVGGGGRGLLRACHQGGNSRREGSSLQFNCRPPSRSMLHGAKPAWLQRTTHPFSGPAWSLKSCTALLPARAKSSTPNASNVRTTCVWGGRGWGGEGRSKQGLLSAQSWRKAIQRCHAQPHQAAPPVLLPPPPPAAAW